MRRDTKKDGQQIDKSEKNKIQSSFGLENWNNIKCCFIDAKQFFFIIQYYLKDRLASAATAQHGSCGE